MMFTVFALAKSVPLTDEQRERLMHYVTRYAKTRNGLWLNDFEFRAIALEWCYAMKPADGILGAFSFLTGKVYLQPEEIDKIARASAWVELLAPTLIHELRHVWQYKRNKVKYVLCCIPGLRQITLERDAWRETEPAQDFCDELMASEDSFRYAQTHGGIDDAESE